MSEVALSVAELAIGGLTTTDLIARLIRRSREEAKERARLRAEYRTLFYPLRSRSEHANLTLPKKYVYWPKNRKEQMPSNKIALAAYSKYLLSSWYDRTKITLGFKPKRPDLGETLTSIGSSASTGESRSTFEILNVNPHVQLPWYYDNSSHQNRIVLRYSGGKVEHEPKYGIRDQKGELVPLKVGSDGFIFQDYLLVSRLPNRLTAVARKKLRTHFVIGGIFGTGTRAFANVLRDEGGILVQMRKQWEEAEMPDYWQALVRIAVDHDATSMESNPLPIDKDSLVGLKSVLVPPDWQSSSK